MRVNVSQTNISKTFIYGLKVSLISNRQLSKSNKKSLEFYLNLKNQIIKQTLFITATQLLIEAAAALRILAEFAIFAILQILILIQIYKFINNFISVNVFSRITVLMNDFRFKTFYSKSIKSSKFLRNLTTKTATLSRKTLNTTSSAFNLKLSATTIKLSTLPTTASSASASASTPAAAVAAFATSAILFKQTNSKNNNHHRTYNNSSKSNKVFLYYTPRDPRLRIFLLKTKHFFNRPLKQFQLKSSKNLSSCTGGACANKSLLNIFNDLCNYGELISGGACNRSDNKTVYKQLKSTKIICDNLKKQSDNLIVVLTAGATIENIFANFLFNIIVVIAVEIEYIKELLKITEIFLSLNYKQPQLKISNVKSTSGLY